MLNVSVNSLSVNLHKRLRLHSCLYFTFNVHKQHFSREHKHTSNRAVVHLKGPIKTYTRIHTRTPNTQTTHGGEWKHRGQWDFYEVLFLWQWKQQQVEVGQSNLDVTDRDLNEKVRITSLGCNYSTHGCRSVRDGSVGSRERTHAITRGVAAGKAAVFW